MAIMSRRTGLLGVLLLGVILGWLALPKASERESAVSIDGSSTVFLITEAVVEEFQRANRGSVRVTVGISGTGGGFRKFCRGETDVQDASRPILADEMESCRKNGVQYHELPVAFDAITVAVNPANTWADFITAAELRTIWEASAQGRVTRWNQVRSSWPDAPLKLFGAGPDSGTFDYFTTVITGQAKASRGDYTASEDDNTLVIGIATDAHSLGYLPFAYYEMNRKRLKPLAVDGGKGPVFPSHETIANGSYQPLSRPVLIYVNKKSAERPEIRQFVEFYLLHCPLLIGETKYVPLPPEAYRLVMDQFHLGKVGTVFHGSATGHVDIGALLQREAKL